jgi:hypothetical protein
MGNTMKETTVEVKTKAVRKPTMSSAAATNTLTKQIASALVERAERQSGSRMAAYQIVASTVGTSADWIRRFVNGYDVKEPGWTVGWNLIDHYNKIYDRVCDRVELEIATERSKIHALKEQTDATATTVDRMVQSLARAQTPGAQS